LLLPAVTPRIITLVADIAESDSTDHDLFLTPEGVDYLRSLLDSGREPLAKRPNFQL
jgi:hypothetical protein